MKKFLAFIKTGWGIFTVLAVIGVLAIIGMSLWNAGARSTVEAKLAEVNSELQNVSARANPDEHLRLLARKKALEQLIAQY